MVKDTICCEIQFDQDGNIAFESHTPRLPTREEEKIFAELDAEEEEFLRQEREFEEEQLREAEEERKVAEILSREESKLHGKRISSQNVRRSR